MHIEFWLNYARLANIFDMSGEWMFPDGNEGSSWGGELANLVKGLLKL